MGRLTLIAVSCVVLLSACTSFRKQGDELYANGDFFGATTLYEKALHEDPSDNKAREGLQRARRSLIDERLLEVRQQRLSDNFSGALNRLLWVVNHENEWNVSPSGPAFSTQEEEVASLYRWFNTQVREDLTQKKYLKAKVFGERYQNVFANSSTGTRFTSLSKLIADGGSSDCRAFKSSTHTPFAREFARRYCMVWGVTEDKADRVLSTGLPAYGRIELTGTIEELPAEVYSALADSLLAGLKSSPFYQAEAGPLKVQTKGRFVSQYDEHQAMAIHSYTVQVPYTVTNTVPYQVQVPYTDYVSRYDAVTNTTITVPVTNYRSETRYREETETRYRDEERSLPYIVTEFNLRYRLEAQAGFDLDKVNYDLPLTEELQLTDRYHDTSNPDIGLYPRPKKMPNQTQWLKDTFNRTGGVLGERIAGAWDTKYCQTPKNLLAATQTETVMKCLKGTRGHHDFVENWFNNRFGMSYYEVQAVLAGGTTTGAQVAGTR